MANGSSSWALLCLFFCLSTLSCAQTLGSTPLISAAKKGDATKAATLINEGADINATTQHGWTALMIASREGHPSVVELLLKSGADPKLVSKRITGNTQAPIPATTALREAIRENHGAIARILIDGGAPVDASAFALAGGNEDLELLEKMLQAGADPNAPSSGPHRYFSSALCVASRKGITKTVGWLLDNGADPNQIGKGCLPLRAAVNGENFEVVKLLLARGADPNIPSSPDGGTPFLHCITMHTRSGRFDPKCEMVKLLLEKGADRNLRSKARPYADRNALEYALAMRDRMLPRVENSEYHATIVKKLEVIIALLEE